MVLFDLTCEPAFSDTGKVYKKYMQYLGEKGKNLKEMLLRDGCINKICSAYFFRKSVIMPTVASEQTV
ncbi:MAG: hypothetical protein BWK80_58130 [Desulfobacteraceae bacterium IS3]|nr:MAG: hypothetical protein BWK80_58130 [Desulfobacteraceae bacterium IS3]